MLKPMITILLMLFTVGIVGSAAMVYETENKVPLDQVPKILRKAIKRTVEKGKLVDIGEVNATAGIAIPGECLIGAAYYQENAPGKAMDCARIEEVNATIETPSGEFSGCLKVWEMNPLDGDSQTKTFAPGIGLVQDEGLLLVKHGFVSKN